MSSTPTVSFGTSYSAAALPAAPAVTPTFEAGLGPSPMAFCGYTHGTAADEHADGTPPSEATLPPFNPAQYARLLKRRQIMSVKREQRSKLGPPPANDLGTVRRRQALRRARNSSGRFASEKKDEQGNDDDEDTDLPVSSNHSSPAA